MARLPGAAKPAPAQQSSKDITDNLTRKINEMRVDEQARYGNYGPQGQVARGARGGRGRGRGGREGGRVAIPTTDFDFETANKKFNKEELAKEAHAGDVANGSAPSAADNEALNGGAAAPADDEVVIPPQQPGAYNKKKSFFDDISSELKDREAKRTFGGPEFRTEERRRNIETFGQGSVDGYRGGGGGGFRGRGGRGGGRGGRGGGGYHRGPRGGIGSMVGPAGQGEGMRRGGPPAGDA
jgi:protein LSM14